MNIQKLFKLAFTGNENMSKTKKSKKSGKAVKGKSAAKPSSKSVKKTQSASSGNKSGSKSSSKAVQITQNTKSLSGQKHQPSINPHTLKDCPVCGSDNVFYNSERSEFICRDCGEIQAQII